MQHIRLGHRYATFGWRNTRSDFAPTGMQVVERGDGTALEVGFQYVGVGGEVLGISRRTIEMIGPAWDGFHALVMAGRTREAIKYLESVVNGEAGPDIDGELGEHPH